VEELKDLQMADSQEDTLAQAEDLSDDSDFSYTMSDSSSSSSDNLETSMDITEVIDLHTEDRNFLNKQIKELEERIKQIAPVDNSDDFPANN